MSIAQYSVQAFNKVSDYHDVRHYGDSDKKLPAMVDTIAQFGDVFIQHGKQNNASLSLSHRHFSLEEGEKKVARQTNETSISIKPIQEDEVQNILDSHPEAKLLPYLFLPTQNKQGEVTLIPLEFVICTNKEHIVALEGDIAAVCDTDFLKDFLKTAEANQVDGVYALALTNKDCLGFDEGTHSTLESGESSRTLVVEVVKNSELAGKDTTTVAWKFRKDSVTGRVIPSSACSSLRHGEPTSGPQCWVHCYNHCYNGQYH